MRKIVPKSIYRIGGILLVFLILAGYWLLPIEGDLVWIANQRQYTIGVWPQIWIDSPVATPNQKTFIYVRDTVAWAHVKLIVDGVEAVRDEQFPAGNEPWIWRWHVHIPTTQSYQIVFYHSCQQGCTERGRMSVGTSRLVVSDQAALKPTKLGVVFANPQRNWHKRSGWVVELTYAERQKDDVDFSIDGLAHRVYQAHQLGLHILVRIAYDRQQALPPVGDEVALERFLAYCRQLAHDDRLNEVYGYVIGAGYNTTNENTLAPEKITTPEWYARIFNGYGLAVERNDNVVQAIHGINPRVRVLVGPVAPWNSDQDGQIKDPYNLPWLNYMNTLVAHIDEATRLRMVQGIPMAAPDGFALRAPGRVDAPQIVTQPSQEPFVDLRDPRWGEAQAGFRVYQDWLAIINRYPTTRGLPAYITSTNTMTTNTATPPTQNYPQGWLTSALQEINHEPQVQALCWFVDASLGDMWQDFSLQQAPGNLHDAAAEFEQLLQQ